MPLPFQCVFAMRFLLFECDQRQEAPAWSAELAQFSRFASACAVRTANSPKLDDLEQTESATDVPKTKRPRATMRLAIACYISATS